MFVGAAFAVTWSVMIGYLVHLHRTMRDARARFDAVGDATKAGGP
jgi:hypothetical protein